MLLSEAWAAYESDKRLEGYSPYTLNQYKLQMGLLIRFLGDIDITEVTLELLKQYLIKKGSHLKASSLGGRIRFIRAFFKWAHEDGMLTKNPASRLREPRQGDRLPKFLNQEIIERLRIACRTHLERALIELFYSTGCRIGEVVTLNRKTIHWDTRSFRVIGKGDREREVYFSLKAEILLKMYLSTRTDDDHALFVTERRHPAGTQPKRLSIDQMRYVVKRIAKRADLDTNVYPHKMRHSFATHLIDNGTPLEVVQRMLGHKKSETTQIYAHLSGERIREWHRKKFNS